MLESKLAAVKDLVKVLNQIMLEDGKSLGKPDESLAHESQELPEVEGAEHKLGVELSPRLEEGSPEEEAGESPFEEKKEKGEPMHPFDMMSNPTKNKYKGGKSKAAVFGMMMSKGGKKGK